MAIGAPFRRLLAAACAVLGVVLVVVAFMSAGAAPERAHRDFSDLVAAQGGSMTHSPTYPDTFRQFSAQARMVQSLLLGGTGIVLVAIGTAAVLRDDPA
ncbi:MAG: hypothetical protein R6T93_10270 [Trueperaceae bacterium]